MPLPPPKSSPLPRREFLRQGAAGLAAATALAPQPATASEAVARTEAAANYIDVNVYVGRWPFRSLRGDDPSELVSALRGHGVVQAWAGSFEAPFHRDMAAVNSRLARICREQGEGLLLPFGSVNPMLPDWEEELRRCHEEHHMPGIRLHPNYHQYTLDDPRLAKLLKLAADRKLIVQLAAWLEDTRHQSPLMPVPEVDLAPLKDVIAQLPDLKLVLLNVSRAVQIGPGADLVQLPQVYCDLGMLDVLDGVATLLETAPAERVLFGSYSPMFYFAGTPLKLDESAIGEPERKLICVDNARGLLEAINRKDLLP